MYLTTHLQRLKRARIESLDWFTAKFNFRNRGHARWFLMSLAAVCIISALASWSVEYFSQFLLSFGMMHLLASVEAFRIVVLMKRDSYVFSKDCIWFNMILAITYLTFWVLIF